MISSKNRILLAGGTGKIGYFFVKRLIQEGFEIHLIVREKIHHNNDARLKYYTNNDNSLKQIFSLVKPNVVITLVTSFNEENQSEIYNSNFIFNRDLFNLAINYSAELFVNFHTLLPKNINYYSRTKHQFVDFILKNSNSINVINISTDFVYSDKFETNRFTFYLFNKMSNSDGPIHLTSGKQLRDFIFIDDFINACILILNNYKNFIGFSQFDIATNRLTSVKEFVLLFSRMFEQVYKKPVLVRLNFGSIQDIKKESYIPKYNLDMVNSLGWSPKTEVSLGIKHLFNLTKKS